VVEHPLAVVLGDAGTVVLDVEPPDVLERSDPDGHGPLAVLHGVPQEVLEQLAEPVGVGHHPRDRFVVQPRPGRERPLAGGPEDRLDVRRFGLLDHPSLVGDPQEVLDEPLHPAGRRLDRLEMLRVVRLPVEFEPSVDDRERGPEVVREDVGELLEPVVLPFERPLVLPLGRRVPADDKVAVAAVAGRRRDGAGRPELRPVRPLVPALVVDRPPLRRVQQVPRRRVLVPREQDPQPPAGHVRRLVPVELPREVGPRREVALGIEREQHAGRRRIVRGRGSSPLLRRRLARPIRRWRRHEGNITVPTDDSCAWSVRVVRIPRDHPGRVVATPRTRRPRPRRACAR